MNSLINRGRLAFNGDRIFAQTTVPKQPNKITVINNKKNISCIYNKDAVIPARQPITANAKRSTSSQKPKHSNRRNGNVLPAPSKRSGKKYGRY